MGKKEKITLIDKILKRGEEKLPQIKKWRLTYLMDIESAVDTFDMWLEGWLAADDENFFHDLCGIINNANRETYPATFGFFSPRYAGKYHPAAFREQALREMKGA